MTYKLNPYAVTFYSLINHLQYSFMLSSYTSVFLGVKRFKLHLGSYLKLKILHCNDVQQEYIKNENCQCYLRYKEKEVQFPVTFPLRAHLGFFPHFICRFTKYDRQKAIKNSTFSVFIFVNLSDASLQINLRRQIMFANRGSDVFFWKISHLNRWDCHKRLKSEQKWNIPADLILGAQSDPRILLRNAETAKTLGTCNM